MSFTPILSTIQHHVYYILKAHHHYVQEGLGLIPVLCILKMKLVPPSLPRSCYVSSSFWFILQCLFRYPVCIHPLYVLQPLFLVLLMHFYLINLFQLNYPLRVSNKQVHHKEVISVQAAYNISHASMGCPASNTLPQEPLLVYIT